MKRKAIIKKIIGLVLSIILGSNSILALAEEISFSTENEPTLRLTASIDNQRTDSLSVKKNEPFQLILSAEEIKDISITLPDFITIQNIDELTNQVDGNVVLNKNVLNIQSNMPITGELAINVISNAIGTINFNAKGNESILSNRVTITTTEEEITETTDSSSSPEIISAEDDDQHIQSEEATEESTTNTEKSSIQESQQNQEEEIPTSYFIINGGFEQPEVKQNSFQFFHHMVVPGWQTTASDEEIEIANGTGGGHRFRPYDGEQWAEINANTPGELYQTVKSIPGSKMSWSVWHAGRDATNTMAINIGTKEAHETVAIAKSKNRVWTKYTGTYTVPEGQYETYFGFESRDATSQSVGNYIDNVSFKIMGRLEATKQVSQPIVNFNDQITYTITTTNSIPYSLLENVTVEDALPEGLELIENSIEINGVPVTNETTEKNNIRVTIPEIHGETEATISFQTKVTTDTPGMIVNTAIVTDPENPEDPKKPEAVVHIQNPNTQVKIQNAGILETKKLVDQSHVKTGDVITYRIEAKNTRANTSLENIKVEDELPEGLELIEGTLKLDEQEVPNEETTQKNRIQITIPEIAGETIKVISFQAKVTQTANREIVNVAKVTDPENPEEPQKPEVPVFVKGFGILETKKLVDQSHVKTGDVITYRIEAKNIRANTLLENIKVEDELPEGLELIEGTLKLDEQEVSNEEMNQQNRIQVTIPEIAGETTKFISFQAKVTQTFDQEIVNIAKVTDPENPEEPQKPEVPVFVKGFGILETKKLVDQSHVKTGDLITYYIEAKNIRANTLLGNIKVEDELPEGIELIEGTLKLDEQEVSNEETMQKNRIQVTIPEIAGETTKVISFQAKVTQTSDLEVMNIAKVTDPENPEEPQKPEVPVFVKGFGILETKKLVDQSHVKTGDVITYRIEAKNIRVNTLLENIKVEDELPEGLELIEGTLKLDDQEVPNEETKQNNRIQVTIPEIAGETTKVISFQAKVTQASNQEIVNIAKVTDPENPKEPQKPEVPVFVKGFGILETKKLVDQSHVKTGDLITYYIEAKNIRANTLLGNIKVEDELPKGLELIEGTLKLDDQEVPNEETKQNNRIQVTIPEIAGETTKVISFQAKVTQTSDQEIVNIAKVTDPENPEEPQKPEVPVFVKGFGILETKKLVDQSHVKTGDVITYRIEAKNIRANTLLENIKVEDELPEGLELIEGTLKLDDQEVPNEEMNQQNRIQVTIPEIAGETTKVISFQAKVTQTSDQEIVNIAKVTNPENPEEPQRPKIPIYIEPAMKKETKRIPNTQNYNSTKASNLPKTNEQKRTSLVIVGMILMFIVAAIIKKTKTQERKK